MCSQTDFTKTLFSSEHISVTTDCYSFLADEIVLSDAGSRSSAPFSGRLDDDLLCLYPGKSVQWLLRLMVAVLMSSRVTSKTPSLIVEPQCKTLLTFLYSFYWSKLVGEALQNTVTLVKVLISRAGWLVLTT